MQPWLSCECISVKSWCKNINTTKEALIRFAVLFKNSPFSKLCVHKQCFQCSCSRVETLVILRAKCHVVLSLLSVLKIVILMLSLICPMHSHWNWVWPENTVNLKSASFAVIILLHKGLTHIHSQKKRFTLKVWGVLWPSVFIFSFWLCLIVWLLLFCMSSSKQHSCPTTCQPELNLLTVGHVFSIFAGNLGELVPWSDFTINNQQVKTG